jgi:hypothetical protein
MLDYSHAVHREERLGCKLRGDLGKMSVADPNADQAFDSSFNSAPRSKTDLAIVIEEDRYRPSAAVPGRKMQI